MKDCSTDVMAFHDEKVTLLQAQRTKMRDRRNSNRDRLVSRLKADEKSTPQEFIKQGSYAMLTMVQDPDNDYDIDDGVYFTKESLKEQDGNDKAPKDVRQLICNALKDDRFNKQPEVRVNCARIFYEEGYHVDMPVYRIVGDKYELASGDEWVTSRAADVEDWFNRVNQEKSPDESNGRQFRRIVRLLKKFARSRSAWKEKIASGFTITKLAEESYVANRDREDKALRETMKSIHNRLLFNLEVNHPVTPGSKLSGPNDVKTAFLRDKLAEALEYLKILDDQNCSNKSALAAWDKVYNTDFFSSRYMEQEEGKSKNATILANLVATKKDPQVVVKQGGDRFA